MSVCDRLFRKRLFENGSAMIILDPDPIPCFHTYVPDPSESNFWTCFLNPGLHGGGVERGVDVLHHHESRRVYEHVQDWRDRQLYSRRLVSSRN